MATLVQVMAYCLTAPSHYLNQFWLLINEVLWYSPESNFPKGAQAVILYNEFVNYTFEITATSSRGQRVLPTETFSMVVVIPERARYDMLQGDCFCLVCFIYVGVFGVITY